MFSKFCETFAVRFMETNLQRKESLAPHPFGSYLRKGEKEKGRRLSKFNQSPFLLFSLSPVYFTRWSRIAIATASDFEWTWSLS